MWRWVCLSFLTAQSVLGCPRRRCTVLISVDTSFQTSKTILHLEDIVRHHFVRRQNVLSSMTVAMHYLTHHITSCTRSCRLSSLCRLNVLYITVFSSSKALDVIGHIQALNMPITCLGSVSILFIITADQLIVGSLCRVSAAKPPIW